MSSEGAIGPVFFDGIVTEDNYLEMLHDLVVPQLRTKANFQQDAGHIRGVVNNKVYERNLHTVNEMKDYISEVFTEIDGDRNLCHTVYQSVLNRYEDCCKVEGGHSEHLTD